MSISKILVTGGAGFIASNLVDRLLALNYHVVVVDDLRSGNIENLSPKARFYKTDMATKDLDLIFTAEQPDLVYHYAAQISVQSSMVDPIRDADNNIKGSLNVLNNCVKNNVKKVIYTSSGGAIYGEPSYLPCDESHSVQPLSHYGVSKFAVENYLHVFRTIHSLDYTVLRLSNVYGPRQDPYGEAGVIAIFAKAMLSGQPVTINGTGDQERDFIYIQDVVDASIAAIDAGSAQSFNVGTGVGSSINTVFTLLKAASGYELQPTYSEAKPGEVFKIYLNADKAKRYLNWEPRFTLKQGLHATINWSINTG